MSISRTAVATLLLLAASLAGCGDSAPKPGVGAIQQGVNQSFGVGTFIIPMDNARQDTGMFRAYGLVYRLLQGGVPVSWAIAQGKAAGDPDFTVATGSVRNRETSADLALPQVYRAGSFVVDGTHAAVAGPIVDAWLARDTVTVVHELTAGTFTANIERTLTAAPAPAVFNDGYGNIAFGYLNAAGIPDSTGAAWAATSPDFLSEAALAGASNTNHTDGILNAARKYSFVASMHYNPTAYTPEVVQEVRSWLTAGSNGRVHGFFQCEAVETFEANASGHFVSTQGLIDDNGTANPAQVLIADHPMVQFDGAFTVDTGSVDSIGLATGSGTANALHPSTLQLIRRDGSPSPTRMIFLFGNIDGDVNRGSVTHLAGHDYSTATPVSTNPLANGVRVFLNALFYTGTGSGTQPPQPNLSLTKTGPAATNGNSITYTLAYANTGPGTLSSAVLRDALPAGLTFTSATGGGVNAGGVVTWALGDLAAGATGTVTVTASVSANGTYRNTATLTGVVGLTSRMVTSNTLTTVRDTTAPGAPAITTPAANARTNDTTPAFIGTCETGATVEVREGTTVLCSATCTAAAFTCDSTVALTEGNHTVTARQTDPAGNTSGNSGNRTFAIDLTAPAAPTITAPAANTTLTDSTPAISGACETGATVEVLEGTTVLCTATCVAAAYSCDSSTLPDGSHTVTARQTDAAGNLGPASAGRTFSIDTTGPTAPVIAVPAEGARTNDTTPTLSGTCEDGTVTVSEGLRVLCTTTCTAGAFTCTSATLLEGSHTITAQGTDALGNAGPASADRTFAVDLTDPVAPTITTPAGGARLRDTTPTFTGTCETGATVQVREGTTVLCSAPCVAAAYSCDSSTLTEGSHTVTARQTDAAGNTGPNSGTRSFTIDLTAPTAPVISTPTEGSTTSDATPAITGTCETNATVEVLEGTVVLCTDTCNAGVFSCNSSTLTDGAHAIVARQTDRAGNQGPASAVRNFTVDTKDPVAPAITTPAAGARTNDTTPTITGTCETGATVEVFEGARVLCTATCAAGAFSCDSATLTQGGHTIGARQTDPAGNTGPASPNRTFTVDTTAPGAPTITGPAAGSEISDSTPTITGGCETGATVTVLEGTAVLCTATCTAGAFSCVSTALPNGDHTIVARQTDEAGNTSPNSASRTFTIDATPPNAPAITAPAQGSTTGDSTPAISGTCENGNTVEVREGTAVLCTATCTGAVFSCTPATLGDGSHTVTATQTDSSGNTSAASAATAFTVDTTAPDTSLPGTPGARSGSSAAFDFASNETGVTYECRLDGGAWAACPDPHTLTGLPMGSHTLEVRAVDAAGNVDATPASHTWEVGLGVSVTAPAADSVTSDSTPAYAGKAEPGASVEVKVDGAVVCTVTADVSGDWTCTPTTALSEGAHVVTAIATQGALVATSATVPFTVDSVAPQAPVVTAPAQGSTTGTTPTYSGIAEPGATVTVSVDGAAACTAVVDAFGNFVCVGAQPLTPGEHTVTAIATDGAGNASPASTPVTFTVDAGSPPGQPTVTRPAAGSTTGDSTPEIAGFAAPGSTVTVSVDGQVVCTDTADAAGAFTCTPDAPLADGAHTVSATATNANGTGPASPSTGFVVDTQGPLAPVITSPADGATTGPTPTFTGTAEAGATVVVSVDGSAACTAVADAAGAWQCTATRTLAGGTHQATASATDVAGNSGPASTAVGFTVAVGQAPGAPSITTPAAGTVTAEQRPLLSGEAEPGSTVTVSVDGAVVCTALADELGRWACVPSTSLAEGAHSATATATNASGTGPASTPVGFSIDTQAPGAPVVTAPVEGAITGKTPTITGTAEPGATVTVRVDGQVVCVTPADASGAWSCTPGTPLADGRHQVAATATDAAGNVSAPSATVNFVVGVDTDGDGLTDQDEATHGTDPSDADTDNDGVADGKDGVTDTDGDGRIDALDPDSDDDGLLDGTESGVTLENKPADTDPAAGNFVPDADPGTTTNPKQADTDGDALKDGDEDKNHNGRIDPGETDPNSPDTDKDGLTDGTETQGENPTDPTNPDTDGDGLKDGDEDVNHDGRKDPTETDPNDPDSDHGGLNDGQELEQDTNPLNTWDDLYVSGGGGCSSSGAGAPLWALGALVLGLALRRPRRAAAALAVVLALASTGAAQAQTLPSSAAIDVQLYKPGPGRFDVLNQLSPVVCGHLCWNVGLQFQYSKSPLLLRGPDDAVLSRLVDNQLTADLFGSLGLTRYFELGLHLPLYLQDTPGTSLFDRGFAQPGWNFGVGDLRLTPKAQLYKGESGLALGAAVPIVIPTGRSNRFMGSGFIGVQPRLLGEFAATHLKVVANLGFNIRQTEELANLVAGHEFAWGLSGEVPFTVSEVPLAVQAQVHGLVGLQQGEGRVANRPVLADLGFKSTFAKSWVVNLAVGRGLAAGYGAPDVRVMAGLGYQPSCEEPADRDLDRIPDAEDACPDVKGVRSADPKLHGCPPDRDGDGVLDADDACPDVAGVKHADLLKNGCPPDRDADGIPDSEDACADLPGLKTADPKTNGCPPDRDGDGVFDKDDACPDVKGEKSADPKKNGCPSDKDGDGIYDRDDACPTAKGEKNADPKKHGCPPDKDNDGVADAVDACPDVPGVKSGDPKKHGCPPDRDGDGILDKDDACPDVPGVANANAKKNGCPKEGEKVKIEGNKIVILEKVYFATGKDTILDRSFPLLKQVASTLKAHAEILKLRVEGHTDNQGGDKMNLDLSKRRAASVMKYLTGQGIAAGRLESAGYGKDKPVASNETAKGREANRRVEFVVVEVAQPKEE